MMVLSVSRFSLLLLLTLVLSMLLPALPAAAQPPEPFTDGQSATLVLGQPDFTSGTSGTTAAKLSSPMGVVVDADSGKVFVVDAANNRVLRYSGLHAMTRGLAAEAVFGQSSLTTAAVGVGPRSLFTPMGLALDAAGNLWVTDYGNHRVLRFADAVNSATNPAAVQVIGQPDLQTDTVPAFPEEGNMNNPNAVAVYGTTLFVADGNHRRVLRFDNAAARGNDPTADGVLGQADFVTSVPVTIPTAALLDLPMGLAFDSAGRLYVADVNYRRVTRYDTPLTAANGAAADAVLPWNAFDYDPATPPTTSASTIGAPIGVAVDTLDHLYVADGGFHRILRYSDASSASTGATADLVIGQSTFLAGDPASTRAGLDGPYGTAFDAAGNLWVTDMNNHRVLMYARRTTDTTVLSIDSPSGLLNASYDETLSDYTLTFSPVAEITFSLTLSNPFGLITVDGTDYGSTQPIGPFDLAPGESRSYPLTVTATDGSSTRTINVTLVRQGSASTPTPTPAPAPAQCEQTPDLAISPAEINLLPGGSAEVQIAMRNLCDDAPYSGADLLYSLSDGLSAAELPTAWVNLGQRAAWQNLSLAPAETRSFTLVVAAAAALPTTPRHALELYRAGSVQSRIDGVFLTSAASDAAAPAVTADEPAASAPAALPLPAALPNTAGNQADSVMPAALSTVLLLVGVALVLLGRSRLHRR